LTLIYFLYTASLHHNKKTHLQLPYSKEYAQHKHNLKLSIDFFRKRFVKVKVEQKALLDALDQKAIAKASRVYQDIGVSSKEIGVTLKKSGSQPSQYGI